MAWWLILVLCVGLLLSVGVERLMRRFGVRPADPDAARGGFQQLIAQLRDWSARRYGRR
jgi:hypothetical protein